MQVNLFKFLISFFVLRKCQAVMTWRPVNCDGYIFKDKSMDEIWDNAIEMTKNAQSQIGIIPTSPLGMMTTNSRRIGANAKFMYGITFNPIFGTDSAGLAMMNAVKSAYNPPTQPGLNCFTG
jgi:hypothetical protein